jgi:hypothetical protein
MIKTEAQLQQASERIQGLCRAIDSLRADIFPKKKCAELRHYG